MKIKQLLTKTLLVAVGLLAGQSVWADSQTITLTEDVLATLYPNNEVVNYFNFVGMAKEWNDAEDKTNYALATGSSTIKINKVDQYQVTTPASMDMFYVQGIAGNNGFQWRWDTSKEKYGLCNFGNARTLAIAVTKGQIIVMEGGYTATTTGSCGANYALNSGYNTFTATENGYIAFSTSLAHTRVLAILNPSSTAANYTIKYVDENGTKIKDDIELSGEVGSSITIAAEQKVSFLNDGATKKYIYKSDDSSGKTVANDGSTVVTITFREAATYSYTVNAMNGNTKLEELASGTAFEQDNLKVPFHRYYNIDGTLYYKNSNNNEYKETITFDEDNKVVGLDYTVTDKTNVVFFKEAEDIETLTTTSTNGTNTRCSFTKGGYAETDAFITTLTPGEYILIGAGYGGNLVFKAGDTEVLNMATVGYWRETPSEKFVITENTDITFKGGASGGNASLDYVIIRRDIAEETAAFNALKTYADALVAVDNDNSAANSTLAEAITTQANAVAEATTAGAITNATTALKNAMYDYVAAANPTSGNKFDLTFLFTNPNFDNITNNGDAAAQGWFTDIPRTDLGTYNNFQVRTSLLDGKNAVERFTSNVCTTPNTYALYQKINLPAGRYSFSTEAMANQTSSIVMAVGDTEGEAITNANSFVPYNMDFENVAEAELKVGIKISSEGTNACYWMALTNLKLYKEAASYVSVTIASSGYSSLGSAYGLDFANATTSTNGAAALTAFAATESSQTSVKLVSIDEAPAATGVILKGTPGATYTIPVKANAAALTVTNLLHAAVAATDIVANTSYIMQGGQFHLVTADSKVPAGKAYLQAAATDNNNSGGAKALTVVFADELTGIANVNAAEAVQPVKRIVNGQLVIEKSGKCYNAAGAEF